MTQLPDEYKDFYKSLYPTVYAPAANSEKIKQTTIPGYTAEEREKLLGISKPIVNTSPSTDTSSGTTTDTNTSTGTTPSTSGEQSDGSYSFKDYDDLMSFISGMQNQAGEGHDIYKGQMLSASDYTDDFAKWLQDVRDIVMKEVQANPLETDWGKGILDYYGVLGDNSANAVNAATAGENAGNIDSFAAANAERQRVSKLGQGIQSVMGMSTERFNNMIAGLESIGVNTERLFGTQGDLVDTARQYATDLYTTDASSTAAYNELMAQLEGNTTNTTVLDNEAVISALKNAYSNLNVIGGDSEEIDWTATDAETWKEAIEALKTNSYYSGLTDDYLNALVAQIMKGTQAETTAETETNPNMVDISKLPAWIRNLLFIQTT